jgi:hypothetical protein
MKMKKQKDQAGAKAGYATLYILIFASIFLTLLFSLLGFAFTQSKIHTVKENKDKALQISEAGLDYYRWFLAHYPNDLQDGTGVPGPYEHEYSDPEGGAIGKFSLTINGNQKCNTLTSVDINSTGWTYERPEYTKEVYGRYARPSVANYSYIINSNVWAGSDRNIKGRYHSNGGIRMDGTNQSLVTSAVSDWQCTSSFGCSPTQTQPGVFGAGSGSNLWSFPASSVDFVGLTTDFANMKTQAKTSGLYFGSVGGESNKRGYHAILNGDGTMTVYKVTRTRYHNSIHIDDTSKWQRDYYIINKETLLGTYTIPSSCSVVFFEDRLWLEGVVKGKVTIAAADVTQPNYDPDVILRGNISYTTLDGSDGLTLLAENSVVISPHSPDNMSLRGIFVAQKGYFGRNLYPCWYSADDHKTSLTMNGSIVSNGRVGTKWGYTVWPWCVNEWSGYNSRFNSYDRKLANDPPPLTPYVDDEYEFVEWREEK